MASAGGQDKLAISAPSRPRAIIVTPKGPKPVNSGNWISPEDYPADARRAGAEGVVGIVVEVDASGRPTGCTVRESSKNADLDAAACRLTVQRGRFEPARNPRGDAMPGTYVTRVRWDLRGQLRQLPKAGEMVITLTAAPDGTVSDCSYTAKGAAAVANADPCKSIRFAPQAEPSAKTRRIRLTTKVEDLEDS